MGINGRWEAVTVPRWLMVVAGFVLTLLGAGATLGIRYATGEARISSIAVRVDTLRADVELLKAGRAEDRLLLRALATLRCLDGTPRNLLAAADLPCERLVRR